MGINLPVGTSFVRAQRSISFEDAGLTEDNCTEIYENQGGLLGYKSYNPSRNFNQITGFTIDKEYLIILKQELDLSNIIRKTRFPVDLTSVNIIGDGNSYMQGNGHTPALTYLAGLTPFSSNGATFHNFGVGSQNTPMMIADQATQVFPVFVPGVLNILIVEEGGNDVGANLSVVNAVANMKTYCNNARNYCAENNIPLFIIISTKIRRDQAPIDDAATFNAKLVQYNEQTLAENIYYDAIIRPELDSLFLTYTSGGYDPDKIHPNNTGQARYAALYKAAISNLASPGIGTFN